jgi:hypothetical protein
MPLADVQPGMNCTGETVVQGTTITSFDVHVIDIVQDAVEGPRILVQVSGPAVDRTGIAEGFSGSPVYCPDGMGMMRNAGAISEGLGQYGNDVALATPIEQMLGEPVTPPASAPRVALRAKPLLGPLTAGGLSPALLRVLQRAGRRVGRTVVAGPSQSVFNFPIQPLVPGASVGVSYSSGALPIGAVGTVTYRDGQTVWAFGHEMDGAGRRSLLLRDAWIYYVVSNPNDPASGLTTSYKLAGTGHTVGTLTSDTPSAVIGQVGPLPPQVPVDVSATDRDSGRLLTLSSQVADETDIGLPLGTSLVDVVAPLQVAQAATQIYNGPPANESGDMCASIQLRESRAPLRFCNRYVGTGPAGDSAGLPPEVATGAANDIATAFGLLEAVSFARLHVTHFVAHIDARRGLAEAAIVGARKPKRVRAGHTVTIRLLVRVYRGAVRTVPFRFRVPKLRVPKRGHRSLVVTFHGPPAPPGPQSQSDSLAAALGVTLSGGSGATSPPPPDSIAALRQAIASIPPYDGLIASWRGHHRIGVYRDPALLITGRVKVNFRVVR